MTVIEVEPSTLQNWIATDQTVTVPTGTSYKTTLSTGDTVVLSEDTVFKVALEEDIERIIILSGTAVLDRKVEGEGGLVEFEVGGVVIGSTGADVIVTSGADGISVAQLGPEGTVTIAGAAIPPDSGGKVSSGGTFTEDQPTKAKLDNDGDQLLRGAARGPRPPYERMKPLPRKIVEENLNDLSPS